MAFIDFLYGTTVWKMGFVVALIVVGGTMIALLLINRYWSRDLRRDHNDIAGFLIAVVGVVFAILVSSLAITVLTRQDHAETLVTQEAENLEAFDRETELLPKKERDSVHHDMMAYLDAVIDGDWPQMRKAEWPTAASPAWTKLWLSTAALPVTSLADMVGVQDLRRHLDKLAEIRRNRAEIATSGVDRVVWSVVLLGSVSTILFAVLFGVRNFAAHVLMTGLLAFTIALAIIMIIAIDWPYFGGDSVGPTRLSQLRVSLIERDAAR